ncbi:Bug family tripartite tricarboxylate transporter substrate binding protein [Roseomonas sp. BN140053]|uniref:Bug family tripartite tricarboxylate transporter substrate binding protein n=1 Tax=Roseomonas sp. BN140053 TaxID=3391898 RepID=UPI0039E9CC74
MNRRSVLRSAAGAALLAPQWPGLAGAQARYPNHVVTVVNPFPPGGQSDGIGRIVSLHLQRSLGQPVVMENRTGAGGTLGAQYVARAAPDGHTLLFGTTGVFVIAPYVYRNAGYELPTSLVPVAMISEVPVIMAASKNSGFSSVAELVTAAKANPGKVTFGSGGIGSFGHLTGELFATLTGTQLTHVPYRGGAPALNDIVAGQLDLLFDGVSTVGPHVEAGRMNALLATGQARLPSLPNVPLPTELGLADLNLTSWNGFVAPANTPAPVIETLNREINVALATDEARELMGRLSLRALGGPPEAMRERILREAAIYKRIITAASISAD